MKKQLTIGRVASYLLYLALAGMVVFGVSYARYSSTVNGGGKAAVAAMAMTGEITSSEIDVGGMRPGDQKTVTFTVANVDSANRVSEVEQNYSITIKTAGNLPFTFALRPDAGVASPAGGLAAAGGVWRTAVQGSLPAETSASHGYTLTITWPADQAAPEYADEIDVVTLIVDAEQTAPKAP